MYNKHNDDWVNCLVANNMDISKVILFYDHLIVLQMFAVESFNVHENSHLNKDRI